MELYTVAKMSKILKIPESTLRYYRDRHPHYMHSVGSGRKKRYKKEALGARNFKEILKLKKKPQ